MRRVVIVDDSDLDRASLRGALKKLLSDTEVAEAATVSEMYGCLSRPCELLFQDVSLEPRDGVIDSTGLAAIYDVIDTYPDVPIVIVTGHVIEKADELIQGALDCRAVVGFLNKDTYSSDDVRDAVEKARAFSQRRVEETEKPDFVDEVFAEEERRFEEHKRRWEEERALDSERALLSQKAMTGDDWPERARAEAKLCGGDCSLNAMALGRLIDARVKHLYGGDLTERPSFYEKLCWIEDRHGLSSSNFREIWDSWKRRNEVVHASRRAEVRDAAQLAATLSLLESLTQD